eukprot:s610_g17.t1
MPCTPATYRPFSTSETLRALPPALEAIDYVHAVMPDPAEGIQLNGAVPVHLPQHHTTATTTLMQASANPPMLLGGEADLQATVPMRPALVGVTLSPASLHQAACSKIPAAQLRLFAQLDPGSLSSVPFSVMMAGDLPFHIRGAAQWPLLNFARDAAEQCDHAPRSVQILMTSLQGLPEPQVVVTGADLPPEATVVPVDMRPLGLSVFPVPLAPGMSTADVLDAVVAGFPEASERITTARDA